MDKTDFMLEGLQLLVPRRFTDERGWFVETWNDQRGVEHGILDPFVQDNMSYTRRSGTLRGLHFQSSPMAQAKLISVLQGEILDVAVDLRSSSPTFGQHVAVSLKASEGTQFYIPKGFAHGFCTRTDDVIVMYKTSSFYSPNHESGLRWDDPDLGIDWGLDTPFLSAKDQQWSFLRDLRFDF